MSQSIEVIRPPHVRNRFYHLAGLAILAANSVRHRIVGYRTPRPQSAKKVNEAMRYDRAVVENWLRHLSDYLGRDFAPVGLDVLELGPGQDLGTGLLMLALGAKSYTAVDAHRLVRPRTSALHLRLAREAARWAQDRPAPADPATGGEGERTETEQTARRESPADLAQRLREAVEAFHREGEGPLRYVVAGDFDLRKLGDQTFDLVISHSALEHVGRLRRSFEQIGRRVSERAHLVAEVDLQTHTRWIRDADPLNIYRYDKNIYRSFGFSGIPNRKRPDDYLEMLEQTGWYDLRLYPRRVLEPQYVARVEPTLDAAYRGDPERMGWLSMVICASRHGDRSWGGRHG